MIASLGTVHLLVRLECSPDCEVIYVFLLPNTLGRQDRVQWNAILHVFFQATKMHNCQVFPHWIQWNTENDKKVCASKKGGMQGTIFEKQQKCQLFAIVTFCSLYKATLNTFTIDKSTSCLSISYISTLFLLQVLELWSELPRYTEHLDCNSSQDLLPTNQPRIWQLARDKTPYSSGGWLVPQLAHF